ncbi:hypothetical protein CKO38_16745 [Rhodospirillum rubrum]|uniref:DUF4055 domain-containing protein n=1 Tax=Rhodospirillum rubrum TaxID=1085 RepID=UPI0019058C0E|nr:DUF4055 domain-containing protein [Rhodospirillum rubrum]MBK1666147.1 hypothetical protein [Rhodospirillum rubrum]MBK1678291.1 hypothetical protein [Rhodospirillum rubrum]
MPDPVPDLVTAPADPARPAADHLACAPHWAMVRALMGGTPTMRAAGEGFLPRYEAEDRDAYRTRLARAVLLPAFAGAVRDIVGRVFARPLLLGEDVPPRLRGWLEDADLMGNALHRVAERWFTEAVTTGIGWLQVEMPGRDQPEALRRPYLIVLSAEEVIAAHAARRAGRWRLDHARLRFTARERQGFTERGVDHVQVLEPGFFESWRRSGTGWVRTDKGETGLGELPLVPLRLGPAEGALFARPPLEGLAHLNVAHWQSASDQRNILTLGRFAMLALSGPAPEGGKEGGLAVGPKTFLHSPDAAARWYYVEPAGTAIQAGERDLARLEAQMERLALDPLVERSGSQTATAAAIAASQAHSVVKAWALALKDALEQALALMAAWSGEATMVEGGGRVDVSTDFADVRDGGDLDALFKARAAGDLSRSAYLAELQRRGVLSLAFDAQADALAP